MSELLLMCKDTPVYSITRDSVLNERLLPGALLRKTLNFAGWMQTRYSVGSNVSARRLMLRAFGTDNHRCKDVVKTTRALSLSDCYWLKDDGEDVLFERVTPYIHKEWDGSSVFTGGSVSTLFVNGAANKYWKDADTLVKVGSPGEYAVYELCGMLGIDTPRVELLSSDLHIQNFTSSDRFLETMEQSGFVAEGDDARDTAVKMFGERAATLFAVDFLVEHDDRHWGNFGFLRRADTGEYIGMCPYYDFDWAWSGFSVDLPDRAVSEYGEHILGLCAGAVAAVSCSQFQYKDVVLRRAAELRGKLEA